MAKPWALDSHEKLIAAGYEFIESAPCSSQKCLRLVRWYRTPAGKKMPFNDEFITHWSDCPAADDFRAKGRKASA